MVRMRNPEYGINTERISNNQSATTVRFQDDVLNGVLDGVVDDGLQSGVPAINASWKVPREPSVLDTDRQRVGRSANIAQDGNVGVLGRQVTLLLPCRLNAAHINHYTIDYTTEVHWKTWKDHRMSAGG